MTGFPACRFCGATLTRTFVDLGEMPLANSYLEEWQLSEPEARYPLHARVCDECLLVQVDDVVPPEAIFGDYAYFSSYSDSWVKHARRFARSAIPALGLGPDSLVIELASNDGYLLRHLKEAGVPVLGIEPAANVAAVAEAAGIPTEARFFGSEMAEHLVERGVGADLLVANNVLAHVPDLNDFVAGMARILRPRGVISIEVPHLLRLIEGVQFDTIYHEHYSYFSLYAVELILEAHDLVVFDVEELPTHGGSLRIWAARAGAAPARRQGVESVRDQEADAHIYSADCYERFAARVEQCRSSLVGFLAETCAKENVVAYGAAAKGNTLLNFCGVTPNEVLYVVDRSLRKQGRFLPGSRLPIQEPERIFDTRPGFLLILPWNIRDEVMQQMRGISEWGGRFIVPLPVVTMLDAVAGSSSR